MLEKYKLLILNYLFVSIQFVGMTIILLTGPIFASNIFLLLTEVSGILLALWAIFVMKLNNLSVFPDLKEGAIFISNGPYKLIRHPMYLSILVTFTPLVIDHFSFIRLIVLLVIVIDLLFKLQFEEKILIKYFTNYTAYKQNTYKLIPFLY